MSQEEQQYVSANNAFTESEKRAIRDGLSNALDIDFRIATTVEESVEIPPLVVIALGTIAGAFVAGFVAKMGSDAWDYFKKKIVEIAHKPRYNDGTRIELLFQYNGAKVSCSLRTGDQSVMLTALDAWKNVFTEIQDIVEKDNLPGDEAYVYFSFRDGQWKMGEATVMQPFFDRVKFDYQTGKWMSVDPRASRILKEYQIKMKKEKLSENKDSM